MVSNASHPPGEVDELLSALSNRRARAVCRYFRAASSETATIDDLVRYVCAEHEPNAETQRIKLTLHHATLPKLSAAGVVEYDAARKRIQYDGSDLLEDWFDGIFQANHAVV